MLEQHRNFDINIVQQDRGVKLALMRCAAIAFVDGEMIRGIRELLFAVLRDVIYINSEFAARGQFDLRSSHGITNAVFHVLRNAGVLKAGPTRMSSCAGAGTPSTGRNTTTPRRPATSSACAS